MRKQKQQVNLMNHKHIYTVHEGHKDYNCDACGKLFSNKVYLKRRDTLIQFMKATKTSISWCPQRPEEEYVT